MKITFSFFVCAVAALLTGCAAQYTLDGKTYTSKAEFHGAADANIAQVLQGIQPLAQPLTNRSLVFAFPSSAVLIDTAKARFIEQQKSQPIGVAQEILENVPVVNHKLNIIYGQAAQKRNIYKSVRIVELGSMNSSVQPSATEDVVYFVEPERNAGQYFYATAKGGKQVFAWDKTQPGMSGRVNGFLEALQAQAIRE